MTPQQNEQYLRRIARDVRFLSYRAGAPHPIAGGIFLMMLIPFLLIAAVGFVIEVGIQFHWIKPVPVPKAPVSPSQTYWQSVPLLRSTHPVPQPGSTQPDSAHHK
jgi:hypothetical protein